MRTSKSNGYIYCMSAILICLITIILSGYFCLPVFAAQVIPIGEYKKNHDDNIRYTNKIEFYGVSVNETADNIICTYNNKKVCDIGIGHIFNKTKNIDDAYVAKDFPQKGMETLFIPIFTGGANCCAADIVITKTERNLVLSSIESGSGHGISIDAIKKNEDILVSNECIKTIDLNDVDPDAAAWCTATAPRPESCLVFENDQWRFAHPKEKSRLYENILKKEMTEAANFNSADILRQNSDKDYLYSVIVTIAYYSIMEGKTDIESANLLGKIFPGLTITKSKNLIADLHKVISTCSTIESKNLTTNQPPHAPEAAKNSEPLPTGKESRFTTKSCGSITDTKNNLEWFIGPDATMSFDEAKAWIKSLTQCGAGWEMPTIAQLATLYEPQKTAGTGFYIGGKHWPAHLDPLFSGIGSGSWVWSKEEINGSAAKSYNFNQGTETKTEKQNKKITLRAFAVRKTK